METSTSRSHPSSSSSTSTSSSSTSSSFQTSSFPTSSFQTSSFQTSSTQPQESVWGLAEVFDAYADPLDPTTIGPEGVYELCGDMGVDAAGIHVLLLAWAVDAANMGYFTQDEFLSLHSHGVTDGESLTEFLEAVMDSLSYDNDPDGAAFSRLYRYAFDYMLIPGKRTIGIPLAIGMWDMLFPTPPALGLVQAFASFLSSPSCSYRAISRDQWAMFHDFTRLVLSMGGGVCGAEFTAVYSEEAAWPVLFDEFVEYEHERERQRASR